MSEVQSALFVGLTVIDSIFEVKEPPGENQKIVADNKLIHAGGPSTNAAITASVLGLNSSLLSAVGEHPICEIIFEEFRQFNIKHYDVARGDRMLPTMASIYVNQHNANRSVVVHKTDLRVDLPEIDLSHFQLVMFDGHLMEQSIEIAKEARSKGIITVCDGGSWKKGMDQLMPHLDYLICSDDFIYKGIEDKKELCTALAHLGIPHIAISRGDQPLVYFSNDEYGEIPVEHTEAVIDTLGAGDTLHGAFCKFILDNKSDFKVALKSAMNIASKSCEYSGPREWIHQCPKFREQFPATLESGEGSSANSIIPDF